MGLSIPEIPSHAVDGEHARHLEAWHELILVSEDVSLLIADDSPHDSDFENSRNCLRRARPDVAGSEREKSVAAVLINRRGFDLEVSPREAAREVVAVVDLRSALVPWDVGLACRRPLGQPGVEAEPAEEWTADGGCPGGNAASSWREKECVVRVRRGDRNPIAADQARRDPGPDEFYCRLSTHRCRIWERSSTTSEWNRLRHGSGDREERQRLRTKANICARPAAKTIVLDVSAQRSDGARDIRPRAGAVISHPPECAQAFVCLDSERAQGEPGTHVVLGFRCPSLQCIGQRRRGDVSIRTRRSLEAERRHGNLRPRTGIHAANGGAEIRVGVGGIERQHRRSSASGNWALDVSRRVMAKHKTVDAPAFPGDSNSRQQGKRVTASGEASAGHTKLLTGKLENTSIVESLAVDRK